MTIVAYHYKDTVLCDIPQTYGSHVRMVAVPTVQS